MKRWVYAAPAALLAGLAVLTGYQLFDPNRAGFERILRAAPDRAFALMDGSGEIRFDPPPGGEAAVVNLFASWCGPCEAEHPLLIELSEVAPGRLFGLLYKDTIEDGGAFLARLGDPFTEVGVDPDGQGGLEFGLTGVPETFVIGPDGQVRLHVRGPLDEERLGEVLAALEEAG